MADTKTYTTNYNLVKPGQDDFYNVDDFNSNADKLDDALHQHVIKVSTAHAASAISSTATGDVAATNVQAAIAELASEKLARAGGYMIGAINETAVTLASASTMAIGAAAGNLINVTGTTTITAFDTVQVGTRRKLKFASALTVTYNATSMILSGGASINVAAGDCIEFTSLGGGNWFGIYQPVKGYAPRGYGLGEYCTSVSDANNAVLSGFYWLPTNSANMPASITVSSYLLVEAIDNANVKQTFFGRSGSTGVIYVRHMLTNVWQPWVQIPTKDLVLAISGGDMTGAINENYVSMDSADAMDIGAAKGNIAVNGTTTINSFLPARTGTRRLLRFSLPLTINSGSTITLPGVSSIALNGGDILEFICRNGTVWACTNYQPVGGFAPDGFGIGKSATVATTDWNNYMTTGFFSGINLTNAPAASDQFFVMVIRFNDNYVMQEAWGFTGASYGLKYVRGKYSGTWSAWKKIPTSDLVAPAGYGLGGCPTLVGVDANNYKTSGFFYFSTGCSNLPEATYVQVIVNGSDNTSATDCTQIGVSLLTGIVYSRTYNHLGTVWSAWRPITGIIASGSGTGYYWRKWANGDIEQWCDGVAVVNSDGNTQTITFPVAFTNGCRSVMVSTTNNNSAVNNDGRFELISKSATGCVVMAQYTTSTNGNITPSIYAIGY